MKSYLKLIGPSIDKGIDALEAKLNELNKLDKQYLYGDIIYQAISKVVPSHDMLTGQLVGEGGDGRVRLRGGVEPAPNPGADPGAHQAGGRGPNARAKL